MNNSSLDFKERVIIALDTSSKDSVKEIVTSLKGDLRFVKVGMELYYSEGTDIIKYLKDQDLKIFLDLKLHDIPNTVYKAMANLAKLECDIINVHASGGIQMMKAAKGALTEAFGDYDISMSGRPNSKKPFLIGVTQLTSTDQDMMNNELGISGSVKDAVLKLAQNSKEAGLDGVVASPLEVPMIKDKIGPEFITVTPGIRPKSSSNNDQKRVTTPKEAMELGTDYIVVGRAVTAASDPKAAFADILSEINLAKIS